MSLEATSGAMEEWSYVSIKHGALFVMSTGIMRMPVWYVISWGTRDMVNYICYYYENFMELLFHITGAISSRNIFTETIWPLTITNISCTGDEDSILKCDFDTHPNSLCHHRRDASVICQCKIVIKAESKQLALSGDTDLSTI